MLQVTCPSPIDLEDLFLGTGPEEQILALEQHLLQCRFCLETLKTLLKARDTLTGLLRDRPPVDPVGDSPIVAALVQTLQSLRTSPAASSSQGVAVIAIACSSCQKKLSIKETLAGKKVKCPGCGQVLAVPVPAAAVHATECTLPPESSPAPSDSGGGTTSSSRSRLADTVAPDPRCDSSLTDFLSPPLAADELGRLCKYRILKVLGHGGMGVVYRAEDLLLKRTVAVKAMLPVMVASASACKRFLREAQAMAALKHDHIVTIYQVDEERGTPFLAMECLEGEPLDKRLKREKKLPLREVLRIGREAAEGLTAAHERGLIHRDVKPGNIWLEGNRRRVKVLDFGLARAAAQEAGLTQQGAIVGTPAYMAPEQARGDPVDARSDLFSLGVMLYQMCSGRQPFQDKDTIATLMAVATRQPAPLGQTRPDLPAGLSGLVMHLLEKDPDRRPASAAEVVKALQALEKNLGRMKESGKKPGPRNRVSSQAVALKGRPRLPVLIAALVLLVGLLGVGALALIRISSDQGDYVVETDDSDFTFQVSKERVTLRDRKTGRTYRVKVHHQAAGESELEVTDADADLTFRTRTFTVRRNQQVALKAWFERKPAQEKQAPVAANRMATVASPPPDKQVAAMAARLKANNPGFDGAVTPTVEAGVVTELQLLTHHVTDLTPVRALPMLRKLECTGTEEKKGRLANLAPLKGMKLTSLKCSWTKVADLTPLKDLKLTELFFRDTEVADLTPLKDMKLAILDCSCTGVSDLTPLKDMKLTILDVGGTGVSDLTPLKDMKLTMLDCTDTQVATLAPLKDMKLTGLWCQGSRISDLSPLKGMPLTCLNFDNSSVSDLSPLKEMKLTELHLRKTQVADLAPLQGLPLKGLWCDFKPERDAAILRSLKSLEKINDKPVADFWKEVDAPKP